MPSKGFENNKKNDSSLYIVATPIGNLGDMTTRAIEVLKTVDVIACEDTRVSKKLLNHLGIQKPLVAYHEHNAVQMRPKLMEKLEQGESIALISDAGTPLISDPGYKLVAEAIEQNVHLVPIPGASSVVTALMACGLPTDQFAFLGFLPTKVSAAKELLVPWKNVPATLLCFTTPHKIQAGLGAIREVLGECDMVIARELTKMYEEYIRGTTTELLEKLESEEKLRGEIVLAFRAHSSESSANEADVDACLKALLEHMPVKSAVDYMVKHHSQTKNEIYQRAIELKAS